MDNDGLKDILTVRSGYRVGRFPNDPSGQLLWFKNPGHANIKPEVEWEERILINKVGPDIYLKVHDFDNDGVVEIVATHFFTGNRITMYGAPDNEDGHGWADVNALDPNAPSVRSVDISADQGKPFDFEIVDVNGDGLADILATNHQNDNCPAFPDDMDGRVYVIAQRDRSHSSTDGSNSLDIFEDIEKNGVWETHILLKGIRPQPSMVGARGSRAAPGNVVSFYPNVSLEEEGSRPWILVGGDEAGKVWILRPSSPSYDDNNNWNYEAHVIFDINDAYDNPEQTQRRVTFPWK